MLYYESVRLPALSTSPCLFNLSRFHLICSKAGSPKFQYRPFSTSLHGHGPRQAVLCTHHLFFFSCIPVLASGSSTPWPSAVCISGLNPFTCVMDECLLPSGLIRFVTSSYAEFSSDLVVSLLSGWIDYYGGANLPVLTSLGTPRNIRTSVIG